MGSGSDSDPVEGFISYNRKGGRRKYIIAQYSSSASITKLYDSMYYDVNRNVIQFGSEYGTTDVSGTTLTSIDVIPLAEKPFLGLT
jgi:hypothetical protein